ERQGDGGRGSIAVLVDGGDDAIHLQIELARRGLDDAHIRLMGYQPVDRRAIERIGGERLVDGAAERAHRDLEDLAAGHGDETAGLGRVTAGGDPSSAVKKV